MGGQLLEFVHRLENSSDSQLKALPRLLFPSNHLLKSLDECVLLGHMQYSRM